MVPEPAPSPIQVDDFSVQIPLAPNTSHHANIPLYTYHRRSRAESPTRPIPDLALTRSGRSSKIPTKLNDFYLHAAELSSQIPLPSSPEAALSHPGWRAAMHSELDSIYKNDTWDVVPLPPGRKAISTKWVYRVKTHADGTVAKLKARLVARGFQQKAGQDYT